MRAGASYAKLAPMLSPETAREARRALDRRQFDTVRRCTGSELAGMMDIGERSLRRYEAEGAPEMYRWALIGLLYAQLGRGGPEAVPGLVPGADDALTVAQRRRL